MGGDLADRRDFSSADPGDGGTTVVELVEVGGNSNFFLLLLLEDGVRFRMEEGLWGLVHVLFPIVSDKDNQTDINRHVEQ